MIGDLAGMHTSCVGGNRGDGGREWDGQVRVRERINYWCTTKSLRSQKFVHFSCQKYAVLDVVSKCHSFVYNWS